MNYQKEYDEFMAKLAKTVNDLRNDFEKLSPENQQRFINEANAFSRNYGRAITIEDLLIKRF